MIAFGEDEFAVTSYGTTKALCAEAGRWIDMLVADLESGRMPTPSAARYARARASGEGSGAGGSPMPPRPAQTFDAKELGFTLETSEETKRELADIDKAARDGMLGRGFVFD